MNRMEVLSGLFWLGISVFVCIASLKSDIGSLHAPGPGFLPFWSAVVLGLFAIILIIVSNLKRQLKAKMAGLWAGMHWQKVFWMVSSLFLYTLLLSKLGYLITTFGLMIFATAIIDRRRMWRHCINALIIISASYLIFNVFLDVKLPKGIFGF
jgi:putative tricarboxylic transport membrane protein